MHETLQGGEVAESSAPEDDKTGTLWQEKEHAIRLQTERIVYLDELAEVRRCEEEKLNLSKKD